MRIGSLCSGYKGLDIAAEAVTGGSTAWFVEYDKAPSKILAHWWPDVPNHGDVKTTDWSKVEPVDVLTAGYPCQPFSHAGKRKGSDDPRHLWPGVLAAIRHLRPRFVLLENVAGHLSLGFDVVLGDLAAAGFDAEWVVLRAADVGAPHGRARLFIAATDARSGSLTRPSAAGNGLSVAAERGDLAPTDADGADVRDTAWQGPDPADRLQPGSDGVQGNAHRDGGLTCTPITTPTTTSKDASFSTQTIKPKEAQTETTARSAIWRPATGMMSTDSYTPVTPAPTKPELSAASSTNWGVYAPAVARWEHVLGRPAPAPTEPGRTGNPRLSPVFVEWLMGLPLGHVTGVPDLSRNDQLKALGNGVVPQQAAAAFSLLLPALLSEVAA